MTAIQTAHPTSMPSANAEPRTLSVGVLRGLLLIEAALGVAVAVILSMQAATESVLLGGDAGRAAEQTLRFGAGFSFLFAIMAAVASRGVRRLRSWSWTIAALLQLALAIGTSAATMTATWHPSYLLGFAAAAIVMFALSAPSVRQALGQE